MKIKRKSLVLNNVLCVRGEVVKNNWVELAIQLRNLVISKGLYPTGPLLFQKDEITKANIEIYSLYMPVNNKIFINNTDQVSFIPCINIKQGLVIRHVDEEEGFESDYIFLETCAEVNKLKLKKPYYHVCMNMYGEQIVDVFAPIEEE